MRLLLASNNEKKRGELERILLGRGIEVVTPRDLGLDLDPEETGETFEENSEIKARAFAELYDGPVLADDSGLEVDLLDGAPGVRSARYAGPDGNDAANRARLLRELDGVVESRRRGRFVCVLTLVAGDRILAQVRGECEGRILSKERGDGGFGYDPLFLAEGTEQSFAELDAASKDRLSHRGRALRELSHQLDTIRIEP